MSEWYDSQKKPSSYLRKLLKERIEKANPRCELTAEETKPRKTCRVVKQSKIIYRGQEVFIDAPQQHDSSAKKRTLVYRGQVIED